MQAKIVVKPAFTVVGMKYRGNNQNNEIAELWRKFGPHMHEVPNVVDPNVSYGVMDHFDEATGEFDYIAACQVDSIPNIADGMVAMTVPAQTYAVFPTTLSTIGETYEAIHAEWMPGTGYHRVSGPDFELYDEEFRIGDVNSKLYIYIPVERN